MENNSYITVLSTENYLEGVLCLVESLRKTNTKYPISVLITNNVSSDTEDILKSLNLNVIRKNRIDIPNSIKNKNEKGIFSHWSNTFDKLQIFELTQFDKLVYLDSDMYVRKNIDELFEKEDMSATIDRPTGPVILDDSEEKLTSGLMVIKPRNGMLVEFMDIIEQIEDKRESIGDQDILQEHDKQWGTKKQLHLDFKYNMFFPHMDYFTHYGNYSLDDLSVIHFILNKKPFNFTRNQIQQYIQFIEEGKKKTYHKFKDIFPYDYIKCGNGDEVKVLDEYLTILENVRRYIQERKIDYER